jgi:hypothetical protein
MDFYHGTTVKGLTELHPFHSPYSIIKERLVYLTSNKQLALHYIWDSNRLATKMPMLDIRKDGTLVFQEMFSGALEYFYKGLSGYIYHCIGDYPINTDSGVFTCATSSNPVPVTDFEFIEDVYESILQYAEKGTFIYERYEQLPQWHYDIIRGIIIRGIKRDNLLNNPTHPSYKFTKEKFSQYWKEAQVLYDNGIL